MVNHGVGLFPATTSTNKQEVAWAIATNLTTSVRLRQLSRSDVDHCVSGGYCSRWQEVDENVESGDHLRVLPSKPMKEVIVTKKRAMM